MIRQMLKTLALSYKQPGGLSLVGEGSLMDWIRGPCKYINRAAQVRVNKGIRLEGRELMETEHWLHTWHSHASSMEYLNVF